MRRERLSLRVRNEERENKTFGVFKKKSFNIKKFNVHNITLLLKEIWQPTTISATSQSLL